MGARRGRGPGRSSAPASGLGWSWRETSRRLPAPSGEQRGSAERGFSEARRRGGIGERRRKQAATGVPIFHRLVYRVVRRVPRGKVVTYGQVAAILGQPRAARAVGQALRMLPAPLLPVVPWQRVINAAGGISIRGDSSRAILQRHLLEAESLRFDGRGRIDLRKNRWEGPAREWATRLRREL